ncbi:MAG TPA: DUF6496 domain-containing protein [Candidatus Thermoplasmatota archaeon]|nr:DUF6496 domain-containing protein [Candidatus Thermoplasmatota archaeon]
MPTKATTRKAYAKKRQGYATSTAAGEFVREEMHHKEEGRHGKESRKQAIAIGLAKARQVGLKVPRKRPASRRSSAKRPSRSRSRSASRSKSR